MVLFLTSENSLESIESLLQIMSQFLVLMTGSLESIKRVFQLMMVQL